MSNGLNAPQRARYSDHSLALYLAPLLEGRRVAVVGPSSGDVAKRARALGAATVVAFGGTGEGVAIRPLVPGAIAAFQGKLDCVLVPDASTVPLEAVLDETRRALGQDGVVAVASRPEGAKATLEAFDQGVSRGPGYYELHDALAGRFGTVQMVGMGPFVAYALAPLGEASEGVDLDTRLMVDEAAQAEIFVAVASDNPVEIPGITLVQVPPGEVLAPAHDEQSARKLAEAEEARTKAEAKLREVESASAERWVKIQRLEHELKSLDEDARKARERAAKLAKDLEDERKLRQRIELEAQMTRRAPELPRGLDPEELRKANERIAALEKELGAARAEIDATRKRVEDLGRELDETQATEAALRSELDAAERELTQVRTQAAALAAPRAEPERDQQLAQEYARIETELEARAQEVIVLRAQLAERDEAVRELAFALEAAERTDAAAAAYQARERVAELVSLNAGLATEAGQLIEQNELLRERIAQLEAELADCRAEVGRASGGSAPRESVEVPAPPPAPDPVTRAELERTRDDLASARAELERTRDDLASARAEIETLRSQIDTAHAEVNGAMERESRAAGEVRALEAQLGEARARAAECASALDEERMRAADIERQLGEARNDLARQSALVASVEARASRTSLELEGTRAGYVRRVRELENEIERLVQALEVVGTHTADENESVDTLMRELDRARAERAGLALRLRDAEAALALRTSAAGAAEAPPATGLGTLSVQDSEPNYRADQLLADLAATAERLAATEEELAQARQAASAAETRVRELAAELASVRAEREAASAPVSAEALDAARRESAERELLVRSLVAQLEDRDLRLRALERRLIEEVERARRTESEIWEVELRARDQRIAMLGHEIDRLRAGNAEEGADAPMSKSEIAELRSALEAQREENRSLRASLESVRAGLSSILVDGRGAVIAHDLVNILRQIEEPAS